jgi:Ca2+-transporting ATPase
MIGLDGSSIDESGLEKLAKKEFEKAVIENTIFARITPEMKLKIIQTLKAQDEIVAVTGDGVNDILALKEANIGVAMGIRGSDAAREVSDIVLLDDNFSSIVKAVKEGRKVYDNMKKSIQAHIAANVGELFIVMLPLLFAYPLPMLPLAILWMNLITDSLPSLSLSVEPAEKDLMRRKPIKHSDGILGEIWQFILISGIVMFIVSGALFLIFYEQDIEKARTIVITSAVISEMFVVIASRSEKNIWEMKFFGNKFLVFSIILAVILQMIAIYTPLSGVFEFKALKLAELVLVFASSVITLAVLEAWKYFKR